MGTKTTAEITIGRETRTVEVNVFEGCGFTGLEFVATIGHGVARYPVSIKLFGLAEGEEPHRGNKVTVAASGERFQYHLGTCVRNRQARIVGFAATAGITNHVDQTRA